MVDVSSLSSVSMGRTIVFHSSYERETTRIDESATETERGREEGCKAEGGGNEGGGGTTKVISIHRLLLM